MAKASDVSFRVTSIDIQWLDVTSWAEPPHSEFVIGNAEARGQVDAKGMRFDHAAIVLNAEEQQHLDAILASLNQRLVEVLRG